MARVMRYPSSLKNPTPKPAKVAGNPGKVTLKVTGVTLDSGTVTIPEQGLSGTETMPAAAGMAKLGILPLAATLTEKAGGPFLHEAMGIV